jgi:hypothetical protein
MSKTGIPAWHHGLLLSVPVAFCWKTNFLSRYGGTAHLGKTVRSSKFEADVSSFTHADQAGLHVEQHTILTQNIRLGMHA